MVHFPETLQPADPKCRPAVWDVEECAIEDSTEAGISSRLSYAVYASGADEPLLVLSECGVDQRYRLLDTQRVYTHSEHVGSGWEVYVRHGQNGSTRFFLIVAIAFQSTDR